MKHWTLLILLFASLLAASAQPTERPRVGLVLGGGGALGAAHVGVLKVLESADIPIDCIAGTSIGAVVGGLYASGWTAQQLDSLFCSQEWLDLLTDRDSRYSEQLYNIDADGMLYIMGIPIMRLKGKDKAITFDLTRLGALRGDSISARLDQLTGHRGSIDFDRLPVPFRCVSFDVLTLSEVVHRQGSLPDAMRASMSLPGVFKPMKTDTQLLIDGGVADNLPVDVVREMGADVVIAVDLSRKNLGQGNGDADICLRPNLKEFDIASFGRRQVRQMIRIGYVETLARLSQLKRVANP